MISATFNLLLMILGFGLLIFVHELGHFVTAKWAGIRTEAFAIGMGPVVFAWRKGIGFAPGSTHARVVEKTGRAPADLSDEELERHGLGETEYSLRWIPLGGFVKMLGQEDANPSAVSSDPRSYNRCPIGKRMIVVSAGVVMNLILAAVLFIIAFMFGVAFPAPVVGQTAPTLAAGATMPANAEALGITTPGLQPGDVVTHIDGKRAETFADLQIASAMGRPDVPIVLTVEREGYNAPLTFSLTPRRDELSGLLSVGIEPAASTRLLERVRDADIERVFEHTGLPEQGVEFGMVMLEAEGRRIATYEQFHRIAREAEGAPVRTLWSHIDRHGERVGQPVEAVVEVMPTFQPLRYTDAGPDAAQNFEFGLLGLTPLVRIEEVRAKSKNMGILMPGDVVLRLGDLHAPRMREFREAILRHPNGPIEMTVLRDGREVELTAIIESRGTFKREGMLNITPGLAWDVPIAAEPLRQVLGRGDDPMRLQALATPLGEHMLLRGTKFIAVEGAPTGMWRDLREELKTHTLSAFDAGTGARLDLTIVHPTPGSERETVALALSAGDVASLHGLTWESALVPFLFEPVQTVRTAGGNPVTALKMGVEETHKLIVMTYLTIDRLFRRTVGIEQLRGPVGIVHIGTVVADRGLLYLILLLGMISVNLAVINFLPLPIVDGGLFLFLIYEKLKGRPPSIAFQNAVTVLGLFLIGTLIVVVTYNDIVRLLS